MKMTNKKILLVEDNQKFNHILCELLEEEGFVVDSTVIGVQGVELFFRNNYDLIIIDLLLPDINGHEIVKLVRNSSYVPIVIISSNSSTTIKVKLLELGVDDYLNKPFALIELVARVKSILRRSKSTFNTGVFMSLNLEIDTDNRYIKRSNVKTKITEIESKILKYLIIHKDQMVEKKEIIDYVWSDNKKTNDNILNVNIKNIRKKLELNPSEPSIIISFWGKGYMFQS